MKLSAKQQLDLDTITYFIPSNVDFQPVTEQHVTKYFAWSDKGIQLDINPLVQPWTGLHALYWGKQRRDLQVTMYLEDWGNTCTAADFIEEPEFLTKWLSKVMKKPGIYTLWKACNSPDRIDESDRDLLQPLVKLAGRV